MKRSKGLLFLHFVFFILNCVPVHAADWKEMRSVPVQHNGRIKPFDSFARQTLKFVAGKEDWQKEDPTQFMSGMLAQPSKIADVPWIRAEYTELKNTLKLAQDRRFFSLNELTPLRKDLEDLVQSAKDKRDRDLRPLKLEQKAEELYSKVRTVEALISGESFRKLPPAGLSRTRLDLELLYHRLKPFEQAAILYFIAFLIFLLPKKGAWRGKTGAWLVLSAFLFHTLGLASRVYILSRPPVSNMYESMIFMNWALVAFTLLFRLRGGPDTLLGAGAAVSGFVMLYANLLPIDSSLDVVVAVLRSNYWLTIHVLTIVSSYGAFGLAMGLGHRHLFLSSVGNLSKKSAHDSAELIFRILQLGTLLVGTGTFLGGVWANESWGRFWGWDPKETWALITFLGYLVVVHLKYAKKISDFYLALSSVVGFQLVLMTWYGVNFVLGRGLHSYGAGSGGMQWVIYFLLFETVFVGWALLRRFLK